MVAPAAKSRIVPSDWAAKWPQWATGLLGTVVIVELGLLVFQLARPLPPLDLSTPSTANPPVSADELTPASMPSLASLTSRPLFAAGEAQQTTPQETALPSGQVNALAARLSLVGVVAGASPQAIIEDSQTHKSYFVTKGQPVVEGVVVQDIQDNHVVLKYQSETIELNL